MCCARTAALQDGYGKQEVNASIDFSQYSLQHVQKALRAMQKRRFVAVCDMFRSVKNITKIVVLWHSEHFSCVLVVAH